MKRKVLFAVAVLAMWLGAIATSWAGDWSESKVFFENSLAPPGPFSVGTEVITDSMDNVHIILKQVMGEKSEILYSYKKRDWDWTEPLVLERIKPNGGYNCHLLVDEEENPYIFWQGFNEEHQEDFFFSTKKDGIWLSPQRLIPTEIRELLEWGTEDYPSWSITFDKKGDLHIIFHIHYSDWWIVRKKNGETMASLIPPAVKEKPLNDWQVARTIYPMEISGFLGADSNNTLHHFAASIGCKTGYLWFYTYKPENGEWSQPVDISLEKDPRYPFIFLSDVVFDNENNMHLIWLLWPESSDECPDGGPILHTIAQQTGEAFKLFEPVSTFDHIDPNREHWILRAGVHLAIDKDGSFHLVWKEAPEGSICYVFKPKNGQWSKPTTLVESFAKSPNITAGRGKVHLVWVETHFGEPPINLFGSVTPLEARYFYAYQPREMLSVEPEGKYPTTWGKTKPDWEIGEIPAIPAKTALLQNYPNPFNPETWIPYQLAEDAEVIIKIFSLTGSLIRTLELGRQPAGTYLSKDKAAYWDGRDNLGEPVASGVYFYTFKANEFTATKKMIIVR